ncbi:uncharacterized protein PG986_008648 [Apiospora aurea]|uniref:General transcription and DNA repair factor IIH subunit TFB4 n=1 Tax=Apiospora aurea TaxID=335848 RepID=A0ABR1Q5C4_9PEZI
MNRIDASDHYEVTATGQTPSLLTIILDTNPRAWQALGPTLSISAALANILVFVNAHLAFGNDNQVAILAAHSHRAVWLYPKPPSSDSNSSKNALSSFKKKAGVGGDGDVEMTGVNGNGNSHKNTAAPLGTSANKYPQFAAIESSILSSLQSLIAETDAADIPLHDPRRRRPHHGPVLHQQNRPLLRAREALLDRPQRQHHRQQQQQQRQRRRRRRRSSRRPTSPDPARPHPRPLRLRLGTRPVHRHHERRLRRLARPHPYRHPLPLPHASPTFLQQAAFITGGSYVSASLNPRGLLTYLMLGFLPDAEARAHLLQATQDRVDFRAACFCHRDVVDTGFVCSVCLSIFCEVPPGDAGCLTCGTKLALGNYGNKPAVVPRKKKKKKRVNGVSGREETGSATGTPRTLKAFTLEVELGGWQHVVLDRLRCRIRHRG